MALNTLQELLTKKGEDFLNKLFTMNVAIYEKFSGSSFSFEIRNKKMYFYRKDNTKPLNKIDRTINKFYEQPILYITNIKSEILLSLPEYHRFNFEYFSNKTPNYVSYDKTPKNNLILMNIIQKNSKEKNVKIINDIDTIKDYAEKLNVSSFPIFFNGKLDDIQISKIKEYLKQDKETIKSLLNGQTFIEYVITLLNIKINNTFLNKDLKKSMEGIIFLFYDENTKEKIYAKLIDPIFDELISTNKDNYYQDDLISILNSKIIEFMEINKHKFKKFSFTEKEKEDRYIEFISYYFNIFISDNDKILSEIKFNLPKYLTKPEFDLNDLNIKNHTTFQIVNTSKTYREIFKLFLLLFKQKRTKKDEFILDSVIKFQNDIFDKISWITDYDTYEDISNTQQDEYDENNIENDTITEEENLGDISNMKIISLWQKMFEKTPLNEQAYKDLFDVILLVDDFQPFNNNNLDLCQRIYDKYNIPIILVQINNNKTYKPISVDTSKNIFTNVVNEYSDIFKGFVISKKNSIETIIENLDDYKITNIFTNNKYLNYFNIQFKYINDNINIEDFDSLNEYINIDLIGYIKQDNVLQYKRNTPECIHNLYEIIKKDLNK